MVDKGKKSITMKLVRNSKHEFEEEVGVKSTWKVKEVGEEEAGAVVCKSDVVQGMNKSEKELKSARKKRNIKSEEGKTETGAITPEEGMDLSEDEVSSEGEHVVKVNKVVTETEKGVEKKKASRAEFQCTWFGCDKTFGSRGMVKVHEAAVHMGERHPCTWPGCDRPAKRICFLSRNLHKYFIVG